MKLLKYSCPFGGKIYPMYLALASILIPTFGLMLTDISPFYRIAALFGCPIAVLTACFFIEQALTDDEKAICNDCENPLWLPANPALADAVRNRIHFPNRHTFSAVFVSIIFGASILTQMIARESGASIAVCAMAPGGLFVMFQLIYTYLWSTVDETTVYTIIPIDHMYDVRHTGKHGREWYESYIVFYQPDGRYTLHAHDGDGSANSVVIVKHRGMVTWLPYKEERF